jgi:hypothetical protein
MLYLLRGWSVSCPEVIGKWGEGRDSLLKLLQFKDTANGSDIETEQHASETGGTGHGKGTPSVDLVGVGFDRVVLDDHANELRACGWSGHVVVCWQ